MSTYHVLVEEYFAITKITLNSASLETVNWQYYVMSLVTDACFRNIHRILC